MKLGENRRKRFQFTDNDGTIINELGINKSCKLDLLP